MDIFTAAQALDTVEGEALLCGLRKGEITPFYFWLTEHKAKGHKIEDPSFMNWLIAAIKPAMIEEFRRDVKREFQAATSQTSEGRPT